jgi:hypothetical protein
MRPRGKLGPIGWLLLASFELVTCDNGDTRELCNTDGTRCETVDVADNAKHLKVKVCCKFPGCVKVRETGIMFPRDQRKGNCFL